MENFRTYRRKNNIFSFTQNYFLFISFRIWKTSCYIHTFGNYSDSNTAHDKYSFSFSLAKKKEVITEPKIFTNFFELLCDFISHNLISFNGYILTFISSLWFSFYEKHTWHLNFTITIFWVFENKFRKSKFLLLHSSHAMQQQRKIKCIDLIVRVHPLHESRSSLYSVYNGKC